MIDINLIYKGKIPPQDLAIEEAVLGSALSFPESAKVAVQYISPEVFYLDSHRLIFQAISVLFEKGKEIDMLSVTHQLKKGNNLEKVGGAYYIAQISRNTVTQSRQSEYCLILLQLWLRREVIITGHEMADVAYDDANDIHELIDRYTLNLLKLKSGMAIDKEISEVADENMRKIEDIKSGKIKRYGIPTLMTDLDNIINGLIAPDLIVVAGRPGMGKTGFALSIACNVAMSQRIPTGIFSLEMSAEQLEMRFKAMLSGVSASRAMRGNISDAELKALQQATETIETAPIFINDKSTLKVTDIRAKAVEWKANGVKLIIVDYIQLISSAKSKGETRDQEISFISGSLKRLAKELEIPIIALSQLNRSVESRNPPEPRLSDLRESGAIEQDADIVMMLYRPEYYEIKEVNIKGEMVSTTNMCIVNIEKHRNGATGSFVLSVNLPTIHFYNWGTRNPDLFIEPKNDLPW